MTESTAYENLPALEAIGAVRPQWTAVLDARYALGLEEGVLLHAGPALKDASLPAPMLNAAVLSCMHEGWAQSERQAQEMLAAGAVRLEPSFTRSVAIPLAAMVSPKTTLVEISDGEQRYFAYLGSGAGPQQRFGSADLAILDKLNFRDTVLIEGFEELLSAPVDLLSIARAAIREGDDLHNRLSSATSILLAVLSTRKNESEAAQAALHAVAEAPLYFLNLWMPACQLMLLAAQGAQGSSIVTRLCANGREIGLQIAGLPERWFTAPATPVRGPFMKGAPENPVFGPATGDSGVIDAFGLGGQGLRHAPSLQSAFAEYLEADDEERALGMLGAPHPILETPFGLDAAAIARTGRSPLLSTGMVSADGRGLLGRGICAVPVLPFLKAVSALER